MNHAQDSQNSGNNDSECSGRQDVNGMHGVLQRQGRVENCMQAYLLHLLPNHQQGKRMPELLMLPMLQVDLTRTAVVVVVVWESCFDLCNQECHLLRCLPQLVACIQHRIETCWLR